MGRDVWGECAGDLQEPCLDRGVLGAVLKAAGQCKGRRGAEDSKGRARLERVPEVLVDRRRGGGARGAPFSEALDVCEGKEEVGARHVDGGRPSGDWAESLEPRAHGGR